MAAMPRWLVVGLGNPGPQYAAHRHNVGFMVVRRVAEEAGISRWKRRYGGSFAEGALHGVPIAWLMPHTFMNRSGDSVQPAAAALRVPPARLLVVHDELDLPFGVVRIKVGGGTAGHRGLRSLAERLGTQDFVRVRVGIGRPAAGIDVVRWVLSPFGAEERRWLDEVLDRASQAVRSVVLEGPERAMNALHGLPPVGPASTVAPP